MKLINCFILTLIIVITMFSFGSSKAKMTSTDYTVKNIDQIGLNIVHKEKHSINPQLSEYARDVIKNGKSDQMALKVAGVGDVKQRRGSRKDLEDRKAKSYEKVYNIDIEGAHFLGREDAAVSLIVFFDFKCPYCKRGYKIFKKLVEEFPDDLKFVFMHLPLDNHVNAEDLAAAAEAAGEQGKFFEMVDLMFEQRTPYSEENVIELAKKLGLDIDKFKQDIDGLDMLTKVYLGAEEARSQKITATPTVILNTKRIRNSSDINYFKKLIQEEIDKSKKTIN